MELDRRSETICPICGKVKQRTQFHPNPVMNGRKYLTVCKTCITEKLREYIKLLGNEGAALWCLCMELGIPFIRSAWKDAYVEYVEKKKTSIATNLFLMYMSHFLELEEKPTGLWDTDMMLSDFFSEDHTESADLIQQWIATWGKFSKEDGTIDSDAYAYLESTFNEYTKDMTNMDTNVIRRYRDLAKAEFRKRKADETGDIAEIAKAQDNLRKMLEMLRLNEFQSKQMSDEKRAFEYNVSLIENFHPAECEKLQEYLDKVGYEKEKAILMRSIRNAIAESRDYPDIPKEYQ